jgi:hypothetical protein
LIGFISVGREFSHEKGVVIASGLELGSTGGKLNVAIVTKLPQMFQPTGCGKMAEKFVVILKELARKTDFHGV